MTLAQIARRQGGVFTRRQALQVGFASAEIDRRVLSGEWIHVMNDVLMAATTPVTPLLQAWTGILAIGHPVALSGRFAAAVVGLDRAPAVTIPEFVIPISRRHRELPGLALQRMRPTQWQVVWRHGLPLVPVPVMIRQMAWGVSHQATRDVVQHALRRRQVMHEDL